MPKLEEVTAIYKKPLLELISDAHSVHRQHHPIGEIQVCKIVSFKTGGCPEDCAYCAQSVRYQTHVEPLPLMQKEEMLLSADEAIAWGATRICISAAWRGVRDGKAFNTILEVVQELTQKGVEVCCTLGLLTLSHAKQLKEAGLHSYNHNLDTSSDFYDQIISTRTFKDRLKTLDLVEKAGIHLCCGGIIGMGETEEDRIAFLHTLASREIPPQSVPLNFLVPIKGTPLEKREPLPIWDMLRMIATARLLMPGSMVRLSGGRLERSAEEQALCFFAGANSIHAGEKLLTTPNPHYKDDEALFSLFGLKKRPAFKQTREAHPASSV